LSCLLCIFNDPIFIVISSTKPTSWLSLSFCTSHKKSLESRFFFMFVGGWIKPKLLLKRCDRQAGVNIRGTKEIPANIETILMKCVGWNGKPFSLRIQTISEPQSNSNKIMSFWLPVSQNDQVVSRPRNVYRYAN